MGLFENVEVMAHSMRADYCLSWTRAPYRYHVWLDRETRKVREVLHGKARLPILYKNPPIGVERGELGYFPTRHLDANKHADVIDAVFRHAQVAGMFELADRAVEAGKQAEEAERAAAIARERIEAAAPNMLKQLKIIAWAADGGRQIPTDIEAMRAIFVDIRDKARAAITEAEKQTLEEGIK